MRRPTAALEADFVKARVGQSQLAEAYVTARHGGDPALIAAARLRLQQAQAESEAVRRKGVALIEKANPGTNPSDTNYIFLAYVLNSLPVGLVGLVIAAVFSGSMSSMSGEISALGATTVVDLWRRLIGGSRGLARSVGGSHRHLRLGLLRHGLRRVRRPPGLPHRSREHPRLPVLRHHSRHLHHGLLRQARPGRRAFYAALVAEIGVIACFKFTRISFLWYNLIGCVAVVGLAWAFSLSQGPGSAPGGTRKDAPGIP